MLKQVVDYVTSPSDSLFMLVFKHNLYAKFYDGTKLLLTLSEIRLGELLVSGYVFGRR